MTTANEIITELRRMFPERLSMDWDSTQGLVAGNASKNIRKAIVSLEFRDNLTRMKVDMFLFHHPPIFGPKRSVTNPFYRKWKRSGELIYAIHSRMDVVGFTSQALVERLFDKREYRSLKILDDGTNIIELKRQTPIGRIIKRIKSRLKLKKLNAIVKKRAIKRIALHGGEAFQMHHLVDATEENIDLYLGGDMAHHLAEGAHGFDASFIDIYHFSEQEGMHKLYRILQRKFPDVRFTYVEQRPLWTIE